MFDWLDSEALGNRIFQFLLCVGILCLYLEIPNWCHHPRYWRIQFGHQSQNCLPSAGLFFFDLASWEVGRA